MKKKFLLLFLAFVLILSGCGNGSGQKSGQSNITAEDEGIMKEIEKKNYKNLTPEEEKVVEKFEKEAEAEEKRKLDNDYNLAVELDNLREKKETGEASKGSCDAIEKASTCIEYVGSFWTDQQMKTNCEGAGRFSKDSCPEGMAGGCNVGEGVPSDMISWFYLYGGGEITKESLKSAKGACEATPMSKWINAR